jgi:hypothetical protein
MRFLKIIFIILLLITTIEIVYFGYTVFSNNRDIQKNDNSPQITTVSPFITQPTLKLTNTFMNPQLYEILTGNPKEGTVYKLSIENQGIVKNVIYDKIESNGSKIDIEFDYYPSMGQQKPTKMSLNKSIKIYKLQTIDNVKDIKEGDIIYSINEYNIIEGTPSWKLYLK